jgi:Tol biopolymer transport system component
MKLFYTVLSVILTMAVQIRAQESRPHQPVPHARLLTSDGGRVDWSKQNRIAFDRKGRDGFYQIWVINPDGSGESCLTCGQPGAPPKHKGNPAWHPSGRYIVFEAEKDRVLPLLNNLAAPGRGVANDLWLMDAAGSRYWKLVDVPRLPAGGVLHPHFSHDGTKLFWTQLLKSSGKLGIWELKVADFDDAQGGPRLTNIHSFTPGPVRKFYESHGFTPDDKKIIFTAQVETGMSDIFEMDLATGQTVNLTKTPQDWDEHSQIAPDGRHIVWASSRNTSNKFLNLWIMNGDGSEPRMLMDCHARGLPMYSEGIGPGDSSWSPDGKSLAVYLISDQDEKTGSVWILDAMN